MPPDSDSLTARPRSLAQVLTQKITDLTSAFADQAHDHHVGFRALRDLPEQRALADASRGEQPNALALPYSDEGIERAHAERQHALDGPSLQRRRCRSHDWHELALQRRSVIHGLTQPIEHPSEQVLAHRDLKRRTSRGDYIVGSEPVSRS